MTRRAVALAAALALLGAIPATAAAPGSYKGKLYGYKDKKPYKGKSAVVKFKVSGKKVRKFTATPPMWCIGSPFTFADDHMEIQTFYVPSAKLKGNSFSTEYWIKDDDGEKLARNILKGKIRGKSASGTLERDKSYCYGTFRWKARLK